MSYNFGRVPSWVFDDGRSSLPLPPVRPSAQARELADWPRASEARALSDWPPIRPSGPEPGAHDMGLGFFGKLSDNERRLMLLGAVGIGALLWLRRRRKRRRNPSRRSRRRR